jgi:hypothetical protein
MTLFRQERSVLDRCHLFDGCPGVERVVSSVLRSLPRAIYPEGTALDLLIQGAALDVMGELYVAGQRHEEKLAEFVQAYFFEGRTIVYITCNVLGLSNRAHVSSTYRVEAQELVARRALVLVDAYDPFAISAGLPDALQRQAQRWDRAATRLGAALDHPQAPRDGNDAPIPVPAFPTPPPPRR